MALASSVDTTRLTILHKKTDDFRRQFLFCTPAGEPVDLSLVDPQLVITKKGATVVTMSAADWTRLQAHQLAVHKEASFFASLDCLTAYRYRLLDANDNTTLMEGEFKIA